MTSLIAVSNSFSDLKPLSELTKLEKLNLGSNRVALSLDPLVKLQKLQELNLNLAPSVNLKGLETLKSLRLLTASGIRMSDCSALAPLNQLIQLDLSRNALSDASCLNDLQNLQILNISDNPGLTSLAGLQKMERIHTLQFNTTAVKDLEPLRNKVLLNSLLLKNTAVMSIEPLAQLTRLEILDITGSQLANLMDRSQAGCQKQQKSRAGQKYCEQKP